MRIPRMKTEVARDLLDLGFQQIYDLEGRSPESIFEELKKKKPSSPADRLNYLRMAIYYAENADDPDTKLLHPAAWA